MLRSSRPLWTDAVSSSFTQHKYKLRPKLSLHIFDLLFSRRLNAQIWCNRHDARRAPPLSCYYRSSLVRPSARLCCDWLVSPFVPVIDRTGAEWGRSHVDTENCLLFTSGRREVTLTSPGHICHIRNLSLNIQRKVTMSVFCEYVAFLIHFWSGEQLAEDRRS